MPIDSVEMDLKLHNSVELIRAILRFRFSFPPTNMYKNNFQILFLYNILLIHSEITEETYHMEKLFPAQVFAICSSSVDF